jgi:hypothetical protein
LARFVARLWRAVGVRLACGWRGVGARLAEAARRKSVTQFKVNGT